jgi:hypothetical protein
VIDLSPDQVTVMPVDQLGLLILSDLLRTDEWNEYNYSSALSVVTGATLSWQSRRQWRGSVREH